MPLNKETKPNMVVYFFVAHPTSFERLKKTSKKTCVYIITWKTNEAFTCISSDNSRFLSVGEIVSNSIKSRCKHTLLVGRWYRDTLLSSQQRFVCAYDQKCMCACVKKLEVCGAKIMLMKIDADPWWLIRAKHPMNGWCYITTKKKQKEVKIPLSMYQNLATTDHRSMTFTHAYTRVPYVTMEHIWSGLQKRVFICYCIGFITLDLSYSLIYLPVLRLVQLFRSIDIKGVSEILISFRKLITWPNRVQMIFLD